MFRLENKIAWITGAASGLGKALSIGLARKGMKLVLIDKDREGLDQLISDLVSGPHLGLCVDLCCHQDLEKQIDEIDSSFTNVDVLINCAGFVTVGFLDDIPVEAFKKIVDVNFYSALILIKKALPVMRRKRSGQIVNVSSAMGRRSAPINTAYCITKAALNSLTEGFRLEVEDDNINVMLVSPGPMDTHLRFNYERYGRIDGYEINLKLHPPEIMAAKIIRGLEKESRRVTKFTPVEIYLLINFFFPSVADRIMKFMLLRKINR